MDDEILEGIVTVVAGPIEQTAEECLASIMMAATNDGIVMDPVDAAAHLRRYLAEHDAGLIEQLVGTLPPVHVSPGGTAWIRVTDLQLEGERRRALA